MSLNKFRTTHRLVRAQQGHSEAAKDLLSQVLNSLRKETPISFEERKFLLWGLGRLLATKNDPFNLKKTKLTGDVCGPVTTEEVMREAYFAVFDYANSGHPISASKNLAANEFTAPEHAAKYLLKTFRLKLRADTVETYYKKVKADLIRAEAVFAHVQQFESEIDGDLDKSVALASTYIKENTKLNSSPELLLNAYYRYLDLLIDKVDIQET